MNQNGINTQNGQSEETEIDLLKLAASLLQHLPVIITVTVLCAAIGFAYTKLCLPVKYTASTYLYVKNSSIEDREQIASSDLTTSRNLVSTYIVILKNNVVVQKVASELMKNEQIADRIPKCFAVDSDGNISTATPRCWWFPPPPRTGM